MIALVFGVIFRSTSAGSRLYVLCDEVREHRHALLVQYPDHRADIRDAGCDHLVARPDACRRGGDV